MFFSKLLLAMALMSSYINARHLPYYQVPYYQGCGCHDPCDPCRKKDPKVPVPTGYLYASCYVKPNPSKPDLTERVSGYIYFRQKASGGAVMIKLDVSGFDPTDDDLQHGYHVHQYGSIDMGCENAGPHYNHSGPTHGHDGRSNVGDIGNIVEDTVGKGKQDSTDSVISLTGANSIYGRAVVIHESRDEGAHMAHGGGAGMMHGMGMGPVNERIACCKIAVSDDSAWQ